jgi:hypothetical protein
MSGESQDARWQQAAADHRSAVDAFAGEAERVPDERWNEPPAEGKWSPAQVAEHLRLCYVTMGRELAGGTGFRVRVGRLRRWVYRVRILRRMLRQREFVRGAPATREVRPGPGPFERAATLSGLRTEASAFLASLEPRRHHRATRLTHPFFGALTAQQALELCALHLDHHRPHLRRTASSGQLVDEPARAHAVPPPASTG